MSLADDLVTVSVVHLAFINVVTDFHRACLTAGGQMLFPVENISGKAGADYPAKKHRALLLTQVQAARVYVIWNASASYVGIVRTTGGPATVGPLMIDLTWWGNIKRF